jgi:uncharacterized protein YbbC (DUF1343 family)
MAYHAFPNKNSFFGHTLAHPISKNNIVTQIAENASEDEIRQSWEPKLGEFKAIRKKYLLYRDF